MSYFNLSAKIIPISPKIEKGKENKLQRKQRNSLFCGELYSWTRDAKGINSGVLPADEKATVRQVLYRADFDQITRHENKILYSIDE